MSTALTSHLAFVLHTPTPSGEILFSGSLRRPRTNPRQEKINVCQSQKRQSITTEFIIGASGVSLSAHRPENGMSASIAITSNTSSNGKRAYRWLSVLFTGRREKTSDYVLHTVSFFIIQTTKQRDRIVFGIVFTSYLLFSYL